MAWIRQGVLLDRPGPEGVVATHVALPSVDFGDDGTPWLYYSGRDERGRSHICRVRLESRSGEPLLTTRGQHELVLAPGSLGAFDDAGVTNSQIVRDGAQRLLFYTGWSLGVSVPFYFYAGLAISDHDDAAFERVSLAPVLERSAVDPYLTASPTVLHDSRGWRMWYVSAIGWELQDDSPIHRYHVRFADSADGRTWKRNGQVAIDFATGEYAIGRPQVLRGRDGSYRMWFCSRGSTYRLRYADSNNGVDWHRDESSSAAQLIGLAGAWESDMQCYPHEFEFDGTRFLLYNGNGYGASGVGYATWIDEGYTDA